MKEGDDELIYFLQPAASRWMTGRRRPYHDCHGEGVMMLDKKFQNKDDQGEMVKYPINKYPGCGGGVYGV
jgi:hypothetical protein